MVAVESAHNERKSKRILIVIIIVSKRCKPPDDVWSGDCVPDEVALTSLVDVVAPL